TFLFFFFQAEDGIRDYKVTGVQTCALPISLSRATKFLNSVMTADGGGYGYISPDPTETMTSVGLLCRLYLGTGTKNTGIVNGVNRLKKSPPSASLISMYYYYYATQVMHHVG